MGQTFTPQEIALVRKRASQFGQHADDVVQEAILTALAKGKSIDYALGAIRILWAEHVRQHHQRKQAEQEWLGIEPTSTSEWACATCGRELHGRQRTRKYCSKACYGKARAGKRIGGWRESPLRKSGRWVKQGSAPSQ